MTEWKPFRPTEQDVKRITADVAEMPEIQQKLITNCKELKVADRVAHQYQIAGGKVELEVASDLPAHLLDVGLFKPNSKHIGIGRISTGLGCPHLESDPDFLGLMVAFQTEDGKRIDFLGINHPGSPTDNHNQFMALLDATAEGAGVEPPFGRFKDERDLTESLLSNVKELLKSNLKILKSLIGSLGFKQGTRTAKHILHQTARTAISSTAYQTYWTGVVEIGGAVGKFVFLPQADENDKGFKFGDRHLTEEWRSRQSKGAITFNLHWLPYINEEQTPLVELTEAWEERPHPVAQLTFPMTDGQSEANQLWADLALEMGANPGNWVRDRTDSIPDPGTEFTFARKLSYAKSQEGREALPESLYEEVFNTGTISAELAKALKQRRDKKQEMGHIDRAP